MLEELMLLSHQGAVFHKLLIQLTTLADFFSKLKWKVRLVHLQYLTCVFFRKLENKT